MEKVTFEEERVVQATVPPRIVLYLTTDEAADIRALLGACVSLHTDLLQELDNLAHQKLIKNKQITLMNIKTQNYPQVKDFTKEQ